MPLWKTAPGVVVALLGAAALTGFGIVSVQVYRVLHPARQIDEPVSLAGVVTPIEDVRFSASDGVPLTGWLVKGEPSMPYVILCHAWGRSKAAGLDLALMLQKDGFNLLLFDFRGHGTSGGRSSSLGLDEKRDVIGAVDYLESREDTHEPRIGAYGVGMGAYAAVLAALDRPALKVLVLDGLYPDPSFPLTREVYGDWGFGTDHLAFAPQAAFAAFSLTSPQHERAADVLPRLVGRDILLIAPAGNVALLREMQAMYESIPEQRDADGNLVVLPSTRLERLYGGELALYEKRVAEFFHDRLAGD